MMMRVIAVAGALLGAVACTTTTTTTNATGAVETVSTDSRSSAQSRPTADLPTAGNQQRARAKAHTDLGAAYVETGKFGIALDEAKEAIGYDPSYAPAHLLMAQVYAFLEQFDQAREPFERAARLAPGDPTVNNAYGWFLCTQGREQDGIARLEQAARNPYYQRPAQAWTNIGMCNLRRKDDRAAEQAFMRAVQADASNVRALYNLSDIAYRSGNYPRAKEWMNSLQARLPEPGAEVLWLALRIERKLGNKQTETDYAIKLRRSYMASDEYQALMQGKYD